MKEKLLQFSNKTYPCYFDADFSQLDKLIDLDKTIFITDQNLANSYSKQLQKYNSYIIPAGEQHKQQATVDKILIELIRLGADRESLLIGIGGGVITDIVGYVASVYMRGIKFALVPTSILAMVDASVGGKNGVDVGIFKNLVGTVKHPEFIMFDQSLLNTLPDVHWNNGFAEIIKHACIKDLDLFLELEKLDIQHFKNNPDQLSQLIMRNVMIKYNVVSEDEFEKGDRKLLNFGHTIGHAIENKYELLHGHAIAIGMVAACKISERTNGFKETDRVLALLKKYELPVELQFDKALVWDILLKDKKKIGSSMNFVLLEKIGKAIVTSISLPELKTIFDEI